MMMQELVRFVTAKQLRISMDSGYGLSDEGDSEAFGVGQRGGIGGKVHIKLE
jgi:hypothetical protein